MGLLAGRYGVVGRPGGRLPPAGFAAYDDVEHVGVRTVPGVNHYTILFDPVAAKQVADTLVGLH